MFTVIRISGRDGRSRLHYVSLPLVTVLLEERSKYFTLPDEPEPSAEKPSGSALRGQLGVVRTDTVDRLHGPRLSGGRECSRH